MEKEVEKRLGDYPLMTYDSPEERCAKESPPGFAGQGSINRLKTSEPGKEEERSGTLQWPNVEDTEETPSEGSYGEGGARRGDPEKKKRRYTLTLDFNERERKVRSLRVLVFGTSEEKEKGKKEDALHSCDQKKRGGNHGKDQENGQRAIILR